MIENGTDYIRELNEKILEETKNYEFQLSYSTDGLEDFIDIKIPNLYSSIDDFSYDENDEEIPILEVVVFNLKDVIDDLNYLLECLMKIKENS